MKKKRPETYFENVHKSIEKIPDDKLQIIAPLSLFLILSFFICYHFLWYSGNMIALPIPNMMSFVPSYNIQADFNRVELGKDIVVQIKACSSFTGECIPCPNCTVDLFYQYDKDKTLYGKNISLDTNSTAKINIKTRPTWLFVTINGESVGWLRIPKALFWEWIYENLTTTANKLATFETLAWLLTALWVIRSLISSIMKKIKEYRYKREKPSYIG